MMRNLAVAVACWAGLGAAAWAQDATLTATVDPAAKTATLVTGAEQFLLMEYEGGAIVSITSAGQPVRFSVGENAGDTDWMKAGFASAEVVKDTPDEKQVKALFNLAFSKAEPDATTTRGLAAAAKKPAPDVKVQLEVLATIKKGLPCVFVKHRLINSGAPFGYYPLPWFGGGEVYAVDGPAGAGKKAFQGKYAPVSEGKAPWLWLSMNDNRGVGAILTNHEKVYIGEYGVAGQKQGTLYLNTIPRVVTVPTGGDSTMDYVLMSAKDPAAVEALYKQISAAGSPAKAK